MKDILEKIYNEEENIFYSILEDLLITNKKKFIITVNPEIIMKSYKNIEIKEMLLNDNNILVPDGISIIKKAKQYNISIKERITGVDISSKALEICNKNKKSIYLFGSKKEVLDKLIININQKYPNINIVGFSDGYVEDKDKIMKEIISLSPDLILIALGVPNQELLINKYIEKAKKGVFIGVGGTFDVLSGYKKRAPKLFIKLNLEWLYRIICEPTRLKRFIQNNIVFMFKK
jgi:putative N-acetylmannosaminyltransferase